MEVFEMYNRITSQLPNHSFKGNAMRTPPQPSKPQRSGQLPPDHPQQLQTCREERLNPEVLGRSKLPEIDDRSCSMVDWQYSVHSFHSMQKITKKEVFLYITHIGWHFID